MSETLIHIVLLASVASASITCLKVGHAATATWVNSAKQTCTWTGTVGSNFGKNPINGGMYIKCAIFNFFFRTDPGRSYGCNGRYGATAS